MKRRNRNPVLHAMGVSARLAAYRTSKPRPPGAVTPGELERDVLAFLAKRYADRQ